MTALTKAELAEKLFEDLGLNKREAKDMVDLFFDEIRESLSRNEQVKLSGFGNFDLRDKRQRPGRNPKTGEEIPISARRVVKKYENKYKEGLHDIQTFQIKTLKITQGNTTPLVNGKQEVPKKLNSNNI